MKKKRKEERNMRITIVGKEHRTGTGRNSGKPYDMSVIYYTVKRTGVEGVVAEEGSINARMMGYADIVVGGAYDLEYNKDGFVEVFVPAQK